jgi:spore germination cell wall hydrolase CwlJ-like protein
MLARLVYLEANTESLECQMAIVSVVINRWKDGMWGDTLEDVVYYPHQFTPANLIDKTTPTELNYTAVDLVLQNGCTLEPYVMYFRANHHFDWQGYKPYTQIDRVCFGYFEADK